MSAEKLIKAADITLSERGRYGQMLITDTGTYTGTWRKLYVLSAAAFTTLTSDCTTNGTTTPSAAADYGTIAAGTVLYGNITTVKLTSGKVILYK